MGPKHSRPKYLDMLINQDNIHNLQSSNIKVKLLIIPSSQRIEGVIIELLKLDFQVSTNCSFPAVQIIPKSE